MKIFVFTWLLQYTIDFFFIWNNGNFVLWKLALIIIVKKICFKKIKWKSLDTEMIVNMQSGIFKTWSLITVENHPGEKVPFSLYAERDVSLIHKICINLNFFPVGFAKLYVSVEKFTLWSLPLERTKISSIHFPHKSCPWRHRTCHHLNDEKFLKS